VNMPANRKRHEALREGRHHGACDHEPRRYKELSSTALHSTWKSTGQTAREFQTRVYPGSAFRLHSFNGARQPTWKPAEQVSSQKGNFPISTISRLFPFRSPSRIPLMTREFKPSPKPLTGFLLPHPPALHLQVWICQ